MLEVQNTNTVVITNVSSIDNLNYTGLQFENR